MLNRYRRAWRKFVWYWVRRQIRPAIRLPVEGAFYHVNLEDAVIARELYVDQHYEEELFRLFRAMDLSGGVCLDIGANIGLYSVFLSRQVGPKGRVLAFEPEPKNFALLERNLRENQCTNVAAHRTAVGDRTGTISLAVNDTNFGDHRVGSGLVGTPVPLARVDEFTAELPEDCIRLIKIDVQGFECKVFEGMRRTLERNPSAILMVEVFPEGLAAAGDSASALVRLLRGLGYDGWEIEPQKLRPLSPDWAYDLMRGGAYADVLLARDGARLRAVVARRYGDDYAELIPNDSRSGAR